MQGVIKSQTHISAEFDEQKSKQKDLEKTIKRLETDLLKSKTDTKNMEKQLKDLQVTAENAKSAVNDLEQYGRRDMVDICGVPRHVNEDTDQIVIDIAAKLGLTLTKTDIATSHRTKPTPDAPIIVKFISRNVRHSFFNLRSQLKLKTLNDLGFQGATKVYINESLTASNGELLKKTRTTLKGKNFKHIWTKNGTIFLRKEDKSNKIIIRSVKDIIKLINPTNSNNAE